ncbi:MAG TPA: hypothetical protein VEV19_07400 [Ktedonobacteraceae bacterium]|nr:hypothetical protein [Ktedonobacteraceae bacterium]
MGFRYRGPRYRRRYGRGMWGLPFTIFFIIMIVTHSFSGFIVAIVVLAILAAIFRAVLPNMFNSGNMNSNVVPPYQQPQQPYYQPTEQPQQPYYQPPEQPQTPYYQPSEPEYQPYQQGYQTPPPAYQPPEQPYQYQPPQQQNYEEQPQAEYPQEMPPMQQK